MKRHVLLLVFGLLLTILGPASAEAASMKAANDAYARGDWEQAIAGYESLTRGGLMHEDLYYNLGNAHFRAGNYGLAIFGYEQALRIAPGEGDAEYNLRLAREVVAAQSTNQLRDAESLPWWLHLSLSSSIPLSTVLLLLLNAVFFGALVVRRYLPGGFRRTFVTVLSGFLGVSVLIMAGMLAGHIHANEDVHHGIVVGDLVIMREGPDVGLEERGQLHPGLRVTVIATETDWLLVRLGNGVEGWVPRGDVGLFR